MPARDRKALLLAAAERVTYDPDTGDMRWRPKTSSTRTARMWNKRFAGALCGNLDQRGYRAILITLPGQRPLRIRAHSLAWFIVHGSLPVGDIDHINQNRGDNRLANLRDVPRALNARNARMNKRNTSGATGVGVHRPSGKWCAQVGMFGKHHHLGLFDDFEAAVSAVREFRLAHGFTAYHGTPTDMVDRKLP